MLSDVVAERVVRLRKDAGWTREKLAQRCAAIGYPQLTLGVIGSIETGRPSSKGGPRTREVTVDELAALALALDVPPVILLSDPRTRSTVPLGDRERLAWSALLWLIGSGQIVDPDGLSNYGAASWLVHAAWTYAECLGALGRRTMAMTPEQEQERTDKMHRTALETMVKALMRIRENAPLPQIPEAVRKRAAELEVALPTDEENGVRVTVP